MKNFFLHNKPILFDAGSLLVNINVLKKWEISILSPVHIEIKRQDFTNGPINI